LDDLPGEPRIRAFKQALIDRNLPLERHLIIKGRNYFYSSGAIVDKILKNKYLPDALLIVDSSLEQNAVLTLQNEGLI